MKSPTLVKRERVTTGKMFEEIKKGGRAKRGEKNWLEQDENCSS